MVYVFLADGFEEIEALTPIDILRRAGVSVTSVGVTGKTVTGSHGISVEADVTESEAADALSRADIEAVVLPGGMPGADNLNASSVVEKYISAALSPASVCKVEITDEETKSCRATVPDGQLSLAIGNKGQNARLAARLTGWRIDIRPESGFYGEDEDDEPKTEEKSEDVLDLDESTEGETVVSDETEE